MTHLKIGDPAPEFTAKLGEDKTIKLSDLRGAALVLYFYPKDDTPGCTIEANDFNKLKSEFEKHNTIIIGISKDDLKSHAKFKEKYCLEFDLAVDDSNIAETYGVWAEKSMFGKKYMGINRSTFLIDKLGKISHIWPNVSVANHAQDVLSKAQNL